MSLGHSLSLALREQTNKRVSNLGKIIKVNNKNRPRRANYVQKPVQVLLRVKREKKIVRELACTYWNPRILCNWAMVEKKYIPYFPYDLLYTSVNQQVLQMSAYCVCVFCVCDCTHAYWVERTAKYLGKLFNLMRLKTFCKVRAHKKNPKGVTLGNPIWSRNHWRQRVSHAALPTPVPTDQQRREPLSNSNFNFEENYPKNAPRSGTFSPPQQSVRSNERKSGSP